MKILCICPIGIGNYLLMYPACARLKTARPELSLHLLALRGGIADIACGDPLWSGVHCIDPTRFPSLSEQLRLIGRLSGENFQASLNFFPTNTWQYNLLPFLARIPARFAFRYPLKQGGSLSFLSTRFVPVDPEAHDVDQNFRMAAAFTGSDIDNTAAVFPALFTEKERVAANAYLAQSDGPERWVGIHPGSSGEHGMAAKRWDPMRFGELAGRICNELKAGALVFGGPDEEKIKHVTATMIRPPYRIVAAADLRTTAALIARCSVFLCNDSGLMHMAATMKVPVVALFGPTDEKRNGPFGPGHLVIRKPMDGFPLWTAATVGVRSTGPGVDPQASLKALSVDDAWNMAAPWLATLG